MAFVSSTLASELNQAYQSYGSISSMVNAFSTAVVNFWNTGETTFGNKAIANNSKSSLNSGILNAFNSYSNSITIVANDISNAIENAAKMIITSGPATHISTSPTGYALLYSGLIDAYSSYPNSTIISANSIADAIFKYSKQIIITGVIPGSPPTTVTGNLL